MGELRTSNIEHPTSNRRGAVVEPSCILGGNTRKFDLENRLLNFASAIIDLSEALPKTRAGTHIASQMLRSGTSPYSNHGEAESAESPEDFIHKLRICLKELRETQRWLRLVEKKALVSEPRRSFFHVARKRRIDPHFCCQCPHRHAKP